MTEHEVITVTGSSVIPKPAKPAVVEDRSALIIKYAFALMIGMMLLALGSGFCIGFLRWIIG